LTAPLIPIPGSSDEVDHGTELLIAQPALTFSAALEPGTDRDPISPISAPASAAFPQVRPKREDLSNLKSRFRP
jgi:hypothetical protein